MWRLETRSRCRRSATLSGRACPWKLGQHSTGTGAFTCFLNKILNFVIKFPKVISLVFRFNLNFITITEFLLKFLLKFLGMLSNILKIFDFILIMIKTHKISLAIIAWTFRKALLNISKINKNFETILHFFYFGANQNQ